MVLPRSASNDVETSPPGCGESRGGDGPPADRLGEAEWDTVGEGETVDEVDALGLTDGELEAKTDALGLEDGDFDGEIVVLGLMDGEFDALGLMDGDFDGDTDALGLGDGEVDALKLVDADTDAEAEAWLPASNTKSICVPSLAPTTTQSAAFGSTAVSSGDAVYTRAPTCVHLPENWSNR